MQAHASRSMPRIKTSREQRWVEYLKAHVRSLMPSNDDSNDASSGVACCCVSDHNMTG